MTNSCTETYIDGSRYEGLYGWGDRNGKGREFDKDGNVKYCIYENGKLISITDREEVVN
jgi:hypothetical protein